MKGYRMLARISGSKSDTMKRSRLSCRCSQFACVIIIIVKEPCCMQVSSAGRSPRVGGISTFESGYFIHAHYLAI